MAMLKSFVLFLFVFGSITSMASSEAIIELIKIYTKEYYPNGKLKAEGWLENNQKEGYWKFYYQNGNLKKEGRLSQDKRTKYWYFYRENGKIESEGHFSKDSKHKWWLFYDKMEKIKYMCQFKNNQKNGYCLRYSNEKLVKAEKYKNGKKIKEWTDLKSFKKENNLSDLE